MRGVPPEGLDERARLVGKFDEPYVAAGGGGRCQARVDEGRAVTSGQEVRERQEAVHNKHAAEPSEIALPLTAAPYTDTRPTTNCNGRTLDADGERTVAYNLD